MKNESKILAHKLIDKASDDFFHKYGYEADIVYISGLHYLHLLREKEIVRKSMGSRANQLSNRSVLGLEIRLHNSKKIALKIRE